MRSLVVGENWILAVPFFLVEGRKLKLIMQYPHPYKLQLHCLLLLLLLLLFFSGGGLRTLYCCSFF